MFLAAHKHSARAHVANRSGTARFKQWQRSHRSYNLILFCACALIYAAAHRSRMCFGCLKARTIIYVNLLCIRSRQQATITLMYAFGFYAQRPTAHARKRHMARAQSIVKRPTAHASYPTLMHRIVKRRTAHASYCKAVHCNYYFLSPLSCRLFSPFGASCRTTRGARCRRWSS